MGRFYERAKSKVEGFLSRDRSNPGSSRPSSLVSDQSRPFRASDSALAPPSSYQQASSNSRPSSSIGPGQRRSSYVSVNAPVTQNGMLAPPGLCQQPSQLHKTQSFIRDPALEEAIRKYAIGLTDKEKAAFTEQFAQSPQELVNKVKALDENHKNSSVSRSLAPGVEKILNTINRFMDVLSVCIQYSPEYSSLVLGGFKCILQLAMGFFGFFQRLPEMMERIGDHLSYLCEYARSMFQKSVPVQKALVGVYCDLLEFCTQARRIFTDEEGRVSRSASLKVFLRLTWDPYEARLRDIQIRFSGHADVVFRAAQVQGMIGESTMHQWAQLRADTEDLKKKGEKRRRALKWLSSIDFEETHERNFSKRFDGTGEWLLNDGNYGTWRGGNESRLLWCYGAPGSGKTILSSLVAQTLLQEFNSSNNVGVAYAYCSYVQSYDPATLVATFIKQLSRQKQQLPRELEDSFDAHHMDARDPTFSELQKLFLDVAKGFDKVFVVLDALDECELKERKKFLPFLQEIVASDGVVKLFVASRRHEDIQRAFANDTTIEIEAAKVSGDIKSYVKSELDRRLEQGTLKIRDPELKKDIFEALLSKAEGMFLWVGFQLDHICEQHTDHEIKMALKRLPENLEQVYRGIIGGINKNNAQRTLAWKVLLWVTYAERPLTQRQLAEAVALEPGMASIKDLDQRMVNDLDRLVNSCANLVQSVPENSNGSYNFDYDFNQGPTVQFVHYSVKEFLLSIAQDPGSPQDSLIPNTYLPRPQVAQDTIACHCLTYLLFAKTRKDFSDSYRNFVIYAVLCWKKHARALTSLSDDFWKLVCKFIHNGNILYTIHALNKPNVDLASGDARLSPLLNASLLNLPLVLDRFKKEEVDMDENFKEEVTAMHWAVKEGSLEAVRLLCDGGSVIDALDNSGHTPLFYVEKTDIASFLLQRGANVNAQGGEYGNPLQAAAQMGRREVVELLLERGADVNAQGGKYGNALQAAAQVGRRELVELLLERGADVNAQGGKYGNALQAAAQVGRRELVELLLERGADVNAQGGEYGNALQAAVWMGRREVVELLLERGADVNAQGGGYGNALQAAAWIGRREVVELLLERGADVNAQGGGYGNALQAAARMGRRELVELLLERGADVNAQGGFYGNALQAAAADGTREVVELLLERGADVNAQGGEYGNALQAAETFRNTDVLKLLKEKGAISPKSSNKV